MGEMEFALNERKRKVTYTNENGTSWTNPASFTNKRIFFGDDKSELVVRSFLMDRTNGDIVVQITVGDHDKVPESQKGKCKKTKTLF